MGMRGSRGKPYNFTGHLERKSMITVKRFNTGKDSTLGNLFVNGDFECFTCEDEKREIKVAGETRIPAGEYKILLRKEGGMNKRYSENTKTSYFHEGMLWLQDVPNFTYVYIHIGNNDDQTEGCILVGADAYSDAPNGGGTVGRSVYAYQRLYVKVVEALKDGEVWINVE